MYIVSVRSVFIRLTRITYILTGLPQSTHNAKSVNIKRNGLNLTAEHCLSVFSSKTLKASVASLLNPKLPYHKIGTF